MDEDNKREEAGQEWVDQILRDIRAEEAAKQAPAANDSAGPQSAAPDQQPRRPVSDNPPASSGTTGRFRSQSSRTSAGRQAAARSPRTPDKQPRRSRRKRTRVRRVGYVNTIIYIVATLAICVVASIFCLRAAADVLAVSRPDKAVEVEIPEGTDTAALAQIYKEAGLIEFPWMFELVAQYEGMGTIEPGSYVLNTNMGYTSLMNAVEKSSQPRETVNVTIPEGYTLSEIADLMEENNVCSASDFMHAVENTEFDYDFVGEIPDDDLIYHRLEGYLFPDTYEFYTNENALNVVNRLLSNFDRRITAEIRSMIEAQGMTLHEVLTLASIIQAEAPDEENMALVSSVYHNRLDNPSEFPLLQADPTRNYADEEIAVSVGIDGQRIINAYNTYEGEGLPPGPINNPGMAAILAAISPAETNYYYFCSDLRTREFFYAETLEEHEQNLVRANLR